MATRPLFASTGIAAFRLSSASLRRTLQMWSEELSRALAAAHRYEQMRISSGTGVPRADRQSKARQVFTELYGGRHPSARVSAEQRTMSLKAKGGQQ
jgi:hypothetical protein